MRYQYRLPRWLAVSVVLLLGAYTCLAAEPVTVNVPALIKDALEHGRKTNLLNDYTYTWRIEQATFKKNGQRESSSVTYEAYSPTIKSKGITRFVMIKTKQDDQPLPPDKLEKERQKGIEQMLRAEAEAQRVNQQHPQEPSINPIGVYFTLSVKRLFGDDLKLNVRTILQQFDFSAPREEVVAGRPTLVLDFRPKPDAVMPESETFLARSIGTIWIDLQNRIVIRVEGWPSDLAQRAGTPAFIYQQVRLNDGVWMPQSIRVNAATYRSFFGKMNTDFFADFTDYKRFNAEVKDVKLQDPTK